MTNDKYKCDSTNPSHFVIIYFKDKRIPYNGSLALSDARRYTSDLLPTK